MEKIMKSPCAPRFECPAREDKDVRVDTQDPNFDPLPRNTCVPEEDFDPVVQLQQEILQRLKEIQAQVDWNKRLDKSTYNMKKSQLLQRMQIEKDEKEYQDCLCREEQNKEQRREYICQEEKLAKALRELKDEEIRQSASEKQLLTCAPEIRELERQLRRGYWARTLFAQKCENEVKCLERKREDDASYQAMMDKIAKQDREAEEKKRRECLRKKEYFQALKNQLSDAASKKAQTEEQFSKDKAMIDEIIAGIQQEEIQDLIEKTEKVKSFQKEIENFLQSQNVQRERERNWKKEQEEQIKKFNETKEQQIAEYQKAKDAQVKARASIVTKAIERIMKEQYRAEELEELRRELYEEELTAEVRRKDLEELARKEKQMTELRAAAAEAKKLRAEKLAADKKEEEEYRRQLMAKFAEDERTEQMAAQKRRQREIEHRKIVEQMIIDQRCLHAQEREREQKVLDCFDGETSRRQKIIEEERLKLLKKHGPGLLGFLPRGVLKTWEEVEKLGEPFISYYRNQPLCKDPTTVDLEPCEEEIFKTMELPKYVKY